MPPPPYGRLKQETTARGCTSNEPRFCPRFSEKIGRPYFKNSGKASPLLFEFCVQSGAGYRQRPLGERPRPREVALGLKQGREVDEAVHRVGMLRTEHLFAYRQRAQTRTIPIIFANIADPVGSGFVASFPRPGGNVTGFVLFEPTMAGKWLELLKEIAPRVNRVAFLFNPATATYFEYYMNSFKAAAASFGVEAIAAPVHDRSELESVFAPQAREPNSSLIVMPDSFLNAHRVEITSLAARYRLSAVYPYRLYTKVGTAAQTVVAALLASGMGNSGTASGPRPRLRSGRDTAHC